jgi:hypothetical protein
MESNSNTIHYLSYIVYYMFAPTEVLFGLHEVLIHVRIVCLHVVKNFNFSLSLLAIFLTVTHHLHRDYFVFLVVDTFEYLAEGTLAKHTSNLIAISDVIVFFP